MLIVQPTSSFGRSISEELALTGAGQQPWQTFEFAVAWINYHGAESIKESARKFLAARGCIRATVGLDFGRTSYEGLGSILELEGEGADITTHVFCDENPACTFHPKVFLFHNVERARLLVGSNNMTGAGLNTNVEAALGMVGALDEETIRAARQTLAGWRDEGSDSRIRRLTRELLAQLRDQRYVLTEEEIRKRRESEDRSRSSQGEPLFGRSSARAGNPGRGTGGPGTGGGHSNDPIIWEVLLMRVRPRRNGNQLQISMTVHKAFMKSAREVVSAVDGSRRAIGYNEARGTRNTVRFEAPEMRGMGNPVARFKWIDGGDPRRKDDKVLQFEVFDADGGGEGAEILRKLEEGIVTPPLLNLEHLSREATALSTAYRASAQWYRLDRD